MRHTILSIILLTTIVIPGLSQNTRSPYSIFGPGELQAKGFGKNMGMGGTGIGMPSGNFINNINPASYSGFDSIRFVYELGFEGKYSNFKSQGDKLNDHTFNFKYVAMGFRVTDWWATSLGIAPFSNVGYTIVSSKYIEGVNDKFYSSFEGSGGINHLYWGNAVKFGNFSFGAHASYLFGSITQDELIVQPNDLFSSFIMERTDYMKSFYFDYGMQYSFKIKNWDYTLGAIYSNKQNLTSDHLVEVLTTSYSIVSSIEEESDDVSVPEKIGIGINMRKSPFINIAADYEFQKWSGINYPIQKAPFKNSHRVAIGAESKPWGDVVTLNWFKKNHISVRCQLQNILSKYQRNKC